jgi:hypothetical protein
LTFFHLHNWSLFITSPFTWLVPLHDLSSECLVVTFLLRVGNNLKLITKCCNNQHNNILQIIGTLLRTYILLYKSKKYFSAGHLLILSSLFIYELIFIEDYLLTLFVNLSLKSTSYWISNILKIKSIKLIPTAWL